MLKKDSLNLSDVKNYRPVSLLPFLSKILEKVVFKQVSDFVSQNNLLDLKQSVINSGHSTETALFSAQSSALILLVLSAASDTVNHDIILSTLSELGISGKALNWFESYLSGGSFNESWQGQVSKSPQLSTGVPQGSVLGPLLFFH